MERRRGYWTAGVSLNDQQRRAVQWMAEREGHGNFSRQIQSLIHREMVTQLGPDWVAELRRRTVEQAAGTPLAEVA